MDLYEVLGLSRDAPPEGIKAAYRKMAKSGVHPDHGGSTESFALIKLAYDTLSDPERRERYDRTGKTDDQPDTLDAKALQVLFSALAQQIMQADQLSQSYETMDFLTMIKSSLELQKRAAENVVKSIEDTLEKRKSLSARFHSAAGKPNHISRMLDAENANALELIRAKRGEIEIIERAEEMAADHSFDFDQAQAGYPSSYSFITTY
jgi:DnaJ-class molecular chaperone